MKLIGIGSDGTAVLTGHIGGAVTLFEQSVNHHVWSPSVRPGREENDQGDVKWVGGQCDAAYLLKQEILKSESSATCPKMTTR